MNLWAVCTVVVAMIVVYIMGASAGHSQIECQLGSIGAGLVALSCWVGRGGSEMGGRQ